LGQLGDVARRIQANQLSEPAWSPFGWLPLEDTDDRDGSNRLQFDWSDVHVNLIRHLPDEVTRLDGGLRCDVMYRHDTHTQVLMPLNCDCVIAVAPAQVELSKEADLDSVRAFRVRPLESLVLDRGTWHWGPFPLGYEAVRLFNVQGMRYSEDNRCADLGGRNLAVEILLPPVT